jgi:hypothetical protein
MTFRQAAPHAGYPQATRQPFLRSIKRFATETHANRERESRANPNSPRRRRTLRRL